MQTQLVTGGAGFIGSCYVLQSRSRGIRIINLDKLTYSGNMENLLSLNNDPNHIFIQGDIGNTELVTWLLKTYQPDAVINFAAESHVDRSILDPNAFVRSNVMGTCALLGAVKDWWNSLSKDKSSSFRFLHISTDEVFGALNTDEPAFTETTPYAPRSPYSASKAASDHFVRAFLETYGLPILLTNCSNNYGPRQFPEKLIPLTILRALDNQPLPIYGKGENIRDWLHVEDHCRALALVLESASVGSSYNIGGRSEKNNCEVVYSICSVLDQLRPRRLGSYKELVSFVEDRPGHDFRYAMNCTKIENDLGWKPHFTFDEGLRSTVQWYLTNSEWLEHIQNGAYKQWIAKNYSERL